MVLQLHTPGQEPILHSRHFEEEFGVDPLPSFRVLLAVVAAAMAKMSSNLELAAQGKPVVPCLIATDGKGTQDRCQ